MAGKVGRSGRPRTPTTLLHLSGNYRRDRHGDREFEPKPPRPKTLRAPSWLTDAGKKHFARLAKPLADVGLLTVLDVPVLGMLAEELAAYAGAIQEAEATEFAKECRSWRRTASAALANVHRLGVEFGLTPSARTKLTVEPASNEDPAASRYVDNLLRKAKKGA